MKAPDHPSKFLPLGLPVWLLSCTFLLFTSTLNGQIINGSFETGSSPELSPWEWTCGAQSWQDAPPDGGAWCIQVNGGNTQGCFPGYAYQRIPNLIPGQSMILSGWAKAQLSPYVGLYFGKINQGLITLLDGDTTSSNIWTHLEILSSFSLLPGDTAVVVLFGGLTGGPLQGFGYFDLVNLCSCIGLDDKDEPHGFTLSPNPLTEKSVLLCKQGFQNAGIRITDASLKVVRDYSNLTGQSVTIEKQDLKPGIYFIMVTEEGHKTFTTKFLIL